MIEYTDNGDAARRAHLEACREAEDRIRTLTGESPPDLVGRVEFAQGEEFHAGDNVLGYYRPDTGDIVVRDAPEAERQRVVVHEGLHALQAERNGGVPLEPRALNEALTQHFTEVADPRAGREIGYELGPDDRVRVVIPDLDAADGDGHVEFVPGPEVYPEATETARALEEVVGREQLLDFYLSGDHQRIRPTVDGLCGRGAWARFNTAVEFGQWELARDALGRRHS